MKRLSVIFGLIVGIFIILIPAFVETKNPTIAWIFFPLFGACFVLLTIFAGFSNKKWTINLNAVDQYIIS